MSSWDSSVVVVCIGGLVGRAVVCSCEWRVEGVRLVDRFGRLRLDRLCPLRAGERIREVLIVCEGRLTCEPVESLSVEHVGPVLERRRLVY